MSRLSLGNFGNVIAKATPLEAQSVNQGLFEGTQSVINNMEKHRQDIEQSQAVELQADAYSLQNTHAKNMAEADQAVLEGKVDPANYMNTVNALNASANADMENKWSDSAFKEKALFDVKGINENTNIKSLEIENNHVNEKFNVQTIRALDEIDKSNLTPLEKDEERQSIVRQSRLSPLKQEEIILSGREKDVDDFWKYSISTDENLVTLEAKKEAIDSAPMDTGKKASFLGMIDSKMKQIETKQNEKDRWAEYETKNTVADIVQQIEGGATVSQESIDFVKSALNEGVFEKNPPTRQRYEKALNIYLPAQDMKKYTVEKNQEDINRLYSEANTKTGDEAFALIERANIMQKINNNTKSAVLTDGITKFSVDTNERIPPFDFNDINSMNARKAFADRATAKYGINVSLFTKDEQLAIADNFKTMPVNDVVKLIANVSANTKNDATIESITKQSDNKTYYKYGAELIHGNKPDSQDVGRAIINGGRLLDNTDGRGVVLSQETVLNPLFRQFRTDYADFFEANPQLMGSYIDVLKYSYANEIGKGSDFAPEAYNQSVYEDAVSTINTQSHFNDMPVLIPRVYKNNEAQFEEDIKSNLSTIFKDDPNLEGLLSDSKLFPLKEGYGVMYGGVVVTYPKTNKPIKLIL